VSQPPRPPGRDARPARRCSEVVALLLDYLEGRLDEPVRLDLQAHLATCASCVAHVHTYRATIDLLHSLTDDDLPTELRSNLRAFLSSHDRN
jgi:anti-sigma factor RsiW